MIDFEEQENKGNGEKQWEVLPATVAGEMVRAEINQTIATAKAYPRNLKKCLEELETLVTMDQDTAASMSFALEIEEKNKETGRKEKKTVPGMSIRMAEAAVYALGNIRVYTQIIEEGTSHVTIRGTAQDMERNNTQSSEVRRRITYKDGGRYSDHLINLTINAGAAIAKRNAIFAVVPRALLKRIWELAKVKAAGDAGKIQETFAKALTWFGKRGVTQEQIFKRLGIKEGAEINQDHLVILHGWKVEIEEGETPASEVVAGDAGEEAPAGQAASTEALNNKLLEKRKERETLKQKEQEATEGKKPEKPGKKSAKEVQTELPVNKLPLPGDYKITGEDSEHLGATLAEIGVEECREILKDLTKSEHLSDVDLAAIEAFVISVR